MIQKLKILGRWALLSIPVAVIGYGVWLIHQPAAFITVGALVWLDLNLKSKAEK